MTKPTSVALAVCVAFAATSSAQTPASGEFRASNPSAGRQGFARTAMEPDGDFIVVWQDDGQDGSDNAAMGQRFAASGAPRGGAFRMNAYTTGFQGRPHVAVGSKGDFVAVWSSVEDGWAGSIHGRRYDTAGNPIGAEFQVNTYTLGDQSRPHVGRAADGRFVVVWSSENIDGSAYGVAARRFDAHGNPIGSDFVVNTYTTGEQLFGDVAVDANGDFVVAWEDRDNNRDGDGSAIFAQRYDAVGNRRGAEFQVNTSTIARQRVPSVSVSPTGGFVVVFLSPDGSAYGVAARRFDAAGAALGNDFAVNTYTPGSQFGFFGQVAHDERGNFVVTWYGPTDDSGFSSGSFGQRFSASGARRGAEFRANTYTTGSQVVASVASDAVGNFVIAWEDFDLTSYRGIFGQRFGGLGPAALVVDSPGNRVLEPGETVEMRPAWRNFNGAAQTFSGTLSDITGPAGASYTISDAAGDYGTVADGATAPCTGCYAVSVSNPTPRPAVHWDASAVESILPDTQGQQKRWLLHVGGSFADVTNASPFYRFIETLLHKGVTGGCTATQYCPASATTRAQMAVFVLVAKEGADYAPPACGATPLFADVPSSNPFCRWIEELARRGVVSGCGGGNYCPGSNVVRDQMAVFVLRTVDPLFSPPACTTPMFPDVPASSPFCRWVEELARRGVVTGCGGGNYCPSASVTREQMGVFISVTFGLTLYGS